ncbi:type I phosphodiesterase / nucleotide pyrophosphatase [Fragilaria crotonensis]|nr:type I phosphodiesterase / nucleotide pyrophosphatase [Fragilaria crotonensis]
MDEILDSTLSELESSKFCILTLVFGDHGMTEDGNHGGGTVEEVNAALFVHASDACPPRQGDVTELSQIDIVPTVSLALGIPIPYANIGGLVPSLLPGVADQNTTLALALNAGQVWRYLTEYSSQANRLPLKELSILLQDAVKSYEEALASNGLAAPFSAASIKFKTFLDEATLLGKRVWTRFDSSGMVLGGILIGAMLFSSLVALVDVRRLTHSRLKLEEWLTVVFVVFTCGVLTFGNSYIENEQSITAFSLSVICLAISKRLWMQRAEAGDARLPLLLPLLARCHELLITGHGTDPSIPMHTIHHSLAFLSCIMVLAYARTLLLGREEKAHVRLDLATLAFLFLSWEKRDPNADRNGYTFCRIALVLWVIGIVHAVYCVVVRQQDKLLVTIKIGIGIMIVTGPSATASLILVCIQVWILQQLNKQKIAPAVHAFLWRLVIRHSFFATNHACAFNRLHLSAAFIASMEFNFVFGGVLFPEHIRMGVVWFVVGSRIEVVFCIPSSETAISCISVSVMRRHLMVWAVFAPRFSSLLSS